MKNITLVWPFNAYYSPSLSLLYQAKILEQKGFDVSVVFSNLLFSNDNLWLPKEVNENPKMALDKVIRTVEKQEPDAVFLGSWREHIPFVAEFSKNFKSRNPKIPLIVGGHTPTFIPEDVLSLMPGIDFIIRGEAEYVLPGLINSLNKPDKVRGISYNNNGKIIHTSNQELIKELDKLPLIDFENVIGNKPQRVELRSSRGCIGQCSFCSLHKMWPKPIRFHSVGYVMRQIKHLKELYDFDYLHFIDEMFLSNPNHARKLALGIKQNFPRLKWGAMLRSDLVTKEAVEEMAKSGFCNTVIGVESVVPKVLEYLNKTNNPSKYIKQVPKSIKIIASFVDTLEIGMITATPVETKQDLIKMEEFIKSVKQEYEEKLDVLRIALGKLVLYPGTKLWEDYKQWKVKIFKEQKPYIGFEGFFYKNYSNIVWAVPWEYTIENPNFENNEKYSKLINETIKRWAN